MARMNSYYCKKCDRNSVVVKPVCIHCGSEVNVTGFTYKRATDLENLRSILKSLEQGDRLLFHAGAMIQEVINNIEGC